MEEEDAWEMKGAGLGQVYASEDEREGTLAFREKRAEKWSGR